MKRIILIAACLLPAAIMAQGKFTINGKVGNLNAPAKAYLYYISGADRIADSTNITAGKFSFKGSLTGISQATIGIKHSLVPVGQNVTPDGLSFYLEPKEIEIISVTDSIKYAVIKDSKVNDDNIKYKALTKSVNDKGNALMKEYRSKTDEERKDKTYMQTVLSRDEAIRKELTALNKQYYTANPDSYVALIAYRNTMDLKNDPKEAESEFNKFSAAVKATDLGKNIAAQIEAGKKTEIGQLAADFIQNDVNDKPVKLSDFKGKFVLIDFWASWCGPCRAENPNVVNAYKRFKDKNFTILGISLDRPGQKDDWLQAIEKDGLTWTHVSDLKYWNNAVARQYGIQSIPANYLIDPSGKIIAKNIRGEELQKKLAEVLGAGQSK